MVKYSVAAIKYVLNPIKKIHGHPQFISLYQLSQRLNERLCKVHNLIHQNDGYVGYMQSTAAYALLSTTAWKDPVDVG